MECSKRVVRPSKPFHLSTGHGSKLQCTGDHKGGGHSHGDPGFHGLASKQGYSNSPNLYCSQNWLSASPLGDLVRVQLTRVCNPPQMQVTS